MWMRPRHRVNSSYAPGYVTETILKSTQIYQGYILECDFVLELILNIE